MSAWLVESAALGQHKADKMIVSAAALADAKAFVESQFQGDGAHWSGATYTELADVAGNADDSLVGWRFRVLVTSPADVVVVDANYVGTDANDDMDAIAAQLVILLNASAIDNASFSTPTLVVATGAGGDDLGDHTVLATVMPPIINDGGGNRENQDVAIPGYIVAQTHEGTANAVLDIDYSANTFVRPTLYKRLVSGNVA